MRTFWKYMALCAAVGIAVAGTASAQNLDRKDVRSGNRHFSKGEFKEAVVDYQKALLRDSTSLAASYNLANTLYRMENFDEAAKVLDSIAPLAEASEYMADYQYNRGNVAAKKEDWQKAVDAYKSALLENPGDLEAKENYIYARMKLQEQQNQDQNQDNQDQNDQNQNQNQDQNKDQNQNNQDQNNQDQNQNNQDQNQNQNQNNRNQDQSQNQEQPSISPQAAQQMLNAIMAKEKETQDKVKKEKAEVLKSKQREKNW